MADAACQVETSNARTGELKGKQLVFFCSEVLIGFGNRILKNGTSHQNYRRPIYDAALNNFASLSMSAALASPITK